jgi:hypothetical protein
MADDELDEIIRELEGLRLRREQLLTRFTAVRERRGNQATEAPLVVGDRVRITNRVRRPNGWPPAPTDGTDQVGTVTRVTSTRVYVTTDTGINTWRAPTNVERAR